uniref:Integron gene cassette protein n=1 Tax=Macrostomum lignano TaxID=282301 RepID=A0A1I8HLZ0_9PLAT
LCNSYVSVHLDELGPARVGLDGVADARVSEVQHAAGAAGPVEQDGPALPALHAEPKAVKLRAHRGVSVAVDRTDVAQPQELCWLQVLAVRRRDRLADELCTPRPWLRFGKPDFQSLSSKVGNSEPLANLQPLRDLPASTRRSISSSPPMLRHSLAASHQLDRLLLM